MSKPTHILITGANGQLGNEFRALEALYPFCHFTFLSRSDLSISDSKNLRLLFERSAIDACVNCAAYTAVDLAETNQEEAYRVNADAVGELAALCEEFRCQLVHISTDYVFDGTNTSGYVETDPVHPINLYGKSKLEGERLALKNNPSVIIVRSSWIFSRYGKNFVKTMIRLMQERETISVVGDQTGRPTYAADLAKAIMQILFSGQPPVAGIYHYCNNGITNWYEFAVTIRDLIQSSCNVKQIATSDYPTPAKRPACSVLHTGKIEQVFQLSIPHWKDSLQQCILQLQQIG